MIVWTPGMAREGRRQRRADYLWSRLQRWKMTLGPVGVLKFWTWPLVTGVPITCQGEDDDDEWGR